MKEPLKMLAFDLGASSGRAILGSFDGEKLELEEIHRFSNDPVKIGGSLHWDILRLFHEIKQGILKCKKEGHSIASLAIDTWGVDFGLLDERGNLLGNPYHYRDSNTDGIMEEVFKIIPKDELYNKTGIQFMKLNTIFQLYSMKHRGLPILREARTLLLTPDLLNYFLTGVKASEYSIATTTQLLDPIKRGWSAEIIERLGLPSRLFVDILPSGSIVGKLYPEIADELGIDVIPVIAVASHDTQSAIASVPAEGEDFIYISCGTWSLMGVEIDQPVMNEKSFSLAFTNEGGMGGKITLLKNIMGLWILQECKRQWEREGDAASFSELGEMAGHAGAFRSFIDPDHELFIAPGNMPARINEYCMKTGQNPPRDKGETVRCILQSLALKYRLTAESLEEILGNKLPVINMVGGGIKDKLLCQLTADVTGRKVIAGPTEASAAGNLLVQAMALGKLGGPGEIREVVKKSFAVTEYYPQNTQLWNEAYERFKAVISKYGT